MHWYTTLTLLLALTLNVSGQRITKPRGADGGAAKKTAVADRPTAALNTVALTVTGTFAAKKLRAYGTVSGTSWRGTDGGTLLQINCESEDQARLTQAKYLSDLDTLPPGTKPGTLTVSGQNVDIRDAGAQGVIAALRRGDTVVVATATSAAALGDLLGKTLGTVSDWSASAETKVPRWLDRFDKYSFHFYYGPGILKPDENKRPILSYDPAEDFAFAAKNHAGITMWTGAQFGETAEWLNNDGRWDWALRSAVRQDLTVGLNLELNSKIHYWIYNRDPLTLMQFAPDFQGSYYGSMNFGIGAMVSWCSDLGQDTLLSQIQQMVKKYHPVDNITAWLEPHEEMGHGPADLLVEYGPVADANYREYLKGKYGSLSAVAARWDLPLRSWDEIKAPEVAEFLGWGPDALDLRGDWRVSYADADNDTALTADFDDSQWPTIVAPGHGLGRLAGTVAPKPVLWRRHFDADSGWLSAHQKVWLYVWDMNDNRAVAQKEPDPSRRIIIALNGKILAETPPLYNQDHRAVFDVTGLVRDRGNVLALRLGRGMVNYRVYLSGEEPKAYPNLGAGKNARWADFYNWTFYIRERALRRGMQMVRQVDPDRGIILMSPDSYVDVIQQAAIDYGGDFHNTGYMGGWWCDRLPAYMRAAGLPMTTEPSQGPYAPDHLSGAFGHWITEGVNAVDLFQYMGEVYWHDDIRKNFEEYVNIYTTTGRYHAATAQVAALYSGRVERLLGFPWLAARDSVNAAGEPYYRGNAFVSAFNVRASFSPMESVPDSPAYESDAVTELSFQKDQCGKYRVIVDTSTSFMDEATVSGIERFVKNGGVFVTYGDSGRHSYEEPDTWPLARLSGFRAKPGKYFFSDTVSVKSERGFLPADYTLGVKPVNGAHYQRVADDAQILATWKDGSAALGWRQIGKGYVVTVGPLWFANPAGGEFFRHLFRWLELTPVPAHFEHAETSGNQRALWRHYVSNSGLYDVWVVFNRSREELSGAVVLDAPLRPAWFIDLKTGERHAMSNGRIPVKLPPPFIVNVYLTPRAVSGAADEWFTLQRGWWSGAAGDLGKPFPQPDQKWIVDITAGWKFKVLELTQKNDPLAEVGLTVSDDDWETRALDTFTHPDHPGARRAVFRRAIQIPATWGNGVIGLRSPEFTGAARLYLDGKPLADRNAVLAVKPGETHLLAVDIQSDRDRALLGARGATWLAYHPAPAARQDLSGDWQPTGDYLNWRPALKLPGRMEAQTVALRRTVQVDAAARGRTVVLQGLNVSGVVINGRYVRPHTKESGWLTLNITPWVRPGADNEFVIIGPGHEVTELALEFHEPGTYP
ncbi:MAG: hypothetical protein LBK71_06580 [Verrucomicrobiales bacterium]|jgi:hypothetical protein|nr:hypothetical protein [Verrucomicrobiales bacterium]